jgi:hypothetical protein
MNRGFIMKTLLFMGITVLSITVFGQSVLAKSDIDDPKQLLVTNVFVEFVDSDIALHINGRCFDNGSDPEIPPTVTIDGIELQAVPGFTDTYMEVTVPGGLDDGDYLMSVSTGGHKSQKDAYQLTIRAAGSFAPSDAMCEYLKALAIKTKTPLPSEFDTSCSQSCPCFTAYQMHAVYDSGWPYTERLCRDYGPLYQGARGCIMERGHMYPGSNMVIYVITDAYTHETKCGWIDEVNTIQETSTGLSPQQYDSCRQEILNSNLWNTCTQ